MQSGLNWQPNSGIFGLCLELCPNQEFNGLDPHPDHLVPPLNELVWVEPKPRAHWLGPNRAPIESELTYNSNKRF